ncbi:MAG: AgmX/PglI C-terminal domain-containing protein [Myxococcales bacterium]|nr:AgmX/PglI C-terminal domain-containing protein [Polyangiaceae bacterium]MDW8250458.1 AgmX/PglI C-terminal domain-containing protein [Myxococcales bacterium]
MSDIPPSEQGKIPSNNGPFVILAVLLGAVLVGLLVVKFKGSSEETKNVATVEPPKPTAAPKPVLTDSVPPPPEEDPEEKPDAGAPKKAMGGSGPCSGACFGSLSSATSSDLRGLSGVARGCYERALRNNHTLQGKMVVNVRVDPSGNVCSVSISGDTLGSPDVSACVLSAFRGKRVAPPTGGCADSTMTLNFQAKDKLSCPHERIPPLSTTPSGFPGGVPCPRPPSAFPRCLR